MNDISPYVMPGVTHYYRYGNLPKVEKAEIIISSVCSYFGMTDRKKLVSPNRERSLVTVRKWCMYFIRRRTNMSVVQMGRLFGRDHTTILHNVSFIQSQLSSKTDNEFKTDYQKLKQLV